MNGRTVKLLRRYVGSLQVVGRDGVRRGPSLRDAKKRWQAMRMRSKAVARRMMERDVGPAEYMNEHVPGWRGMTDDELRAVGEQRAEALYRR